MGAATLLRTFGGVWAVLWHGLAGATTASMEWEDVVHCDASQCTRDSIGEVLTALNDYGAYTHLMYHAYPFVMMDDCAESVFLDAEKRRRRRRPRDSGDGEGLRKLCEKYRWSMDYREVETAVSPGELQGDRAWVSDVLGQRAAQALARARAALAVVGEDAVVQTLPERMRDRALWPHFVLFGAAMVGSDVLEKGVLSTIRRGRKALGLYTHFKILLRDGDGSSLFLAQVGVEDKIDAVPAIKMLLADMWRGRRAEKLQWLQSMLGMVNGENIAFFLEEDFVSALDCLATELRPVLDGFLWEQRHLAPLLHACCFGVLWSVPEALIRAEVTRLVSQCSVPALSLPAVDHLLQRTRAYWDSDIFYIRGRMGAECMQVIDAVREGRRISPGKVKALGRGAPAYRRAVLRWAVFRDFDAETRDFLIGEALQGCAEAEALLDSDFHCRFQCLGVETQVQVAQMLRKRLPEGSQDAVPSTAGQKRSAGDVSGPAPKRRRPSAK